MQEWKHASVPHKDNDSTYPTVSLQGFHEVVVGLCVKVEPFLMHVLKVQVFVGGGGFLPLFPGCPSLVGGSLKVVLIVHFDWARQDVVHDHQPDVDASWLDAVQPVELGQECTRILVQVLRGEKRFYVTMEQRENR